MRACATAVFLTLASAPGFAWEFTPGTPCILTHETPELRVELTYDPTAPLYTISLTRADAFRPAGIFSLQFNGAAPLSISTDRHAFRDAGRTVTVADVGFGNVLNGLQFNTTATAVVGDLSVSIQLAGASKPVAAFRACDVVPAV